MNPKTFVGFGVVTAIIIVWAALSIGSSYEAPAVGVEKVRIFPGLAEKVNDVGEISVRNKTETLTIKKGAKGWAVAERQGFAVPDDKVREVLIGLSQLRRGEKKTKKKEFYKRLQLQDIKVKDTQSMLVRLKDGAGKLMAETLVGRRNREVYTVSGVGRYVRAPGDEQSWLAYGPLEIPDNVKKWVNAEISTVDAKRVRQVSVVQPDGAVMTSVRRKDKKNEFVVANLPPGVKIEFQSDVDNMADGLDGLDLEDVKAANRITFPADKLIKTEYRTSDGLVVNVELAEVKDNEFWARFVASVGEAENGPAGDKIKKEAAKLNERLGKWVYKIPAYKYRYMSRKLDEVLKKEEDKK